MKFLKIFGIFVLAFLVTAGFLNYPKLVLISGFAAKNTASAHFLDGRSLDVISDGDNDIPLVKYANNSIDEVAKSASSSVLGMQKRTAVYREGLGAVLINEDYDPKVKPIVPHRYIYPSEKIYPYGDAEQKDSAFANVNYEQLKKAVANNFDENDAVAKRSRAILVIYKDQIIAEKYAAGFDKKSRLLGWSMTKSVTATMFGVLQSQHKFRISDPAPVPEWKNDKRSNITTRDLLHMNSGLEWEERYDKICDATKMLFAATDMSTVQRDKPAEFEPNSHWNYSSGTSNLLSAILRKQFKTQQEYIDFWYSGLIDRIGMKSMVVETDLAGNFVGSSYAWATTRDWGKFGTLYLHKGNWNGDQVFDKGWSDYVRMATNTSNGNYGAHFWLNAGGKYPSVPRDMYYASGFQGQKIFIFPSNDLVIVRLGLTDDSQFNFDEMLKRILTSIK